MHHYLSSIVLLQIGLVMEDRSKLEHLMGIAQQRWLKGGNSSDSLSVAGKDRQPFEKPARLPLQADTKVGNVVGSGLGSGILSALTFSKDSGSHEASTLAEAGSSIPRCDILALQKHATCYTLYPTLSTLVPCSAADVQPILAEHDAVENKVQSMQIAAAAEESVVVSGPEAIVPASVSKVCCIAECTPVQCSFCGACWIWTLSYRHVIICKLGAVASLISFPVQAQKSPLFKFRFKGLQDSKKAKAGMPSVKGLQGDDGALSSSELILK